jgi:hypothetical protein
MANESQTIDKVTFDNNDFKFIAAYTAYTNKFEEAGADERQRLNELITSLDKGEISFPAFYKEIDDESDQRYKYHRVSIKGSRKFAYRRAQQEKNRINRHKN